MCIEKRKKKWKLGNVENGEEYVFNTNHAKERINLEDQINFWESCTNYACR